MITFFSCPKAFRGDSRRLQTNAIGSWKRILNCEILLFGDDPGTGEFSDQIGAVHLPHVETSPLGTPLVSDLFAQAQERARFDWLCYINSDIILLDDFAQTFERVRHSRDPLVLIGECTDIKLPYFIDFRDPLWQTALINQATKTGKSRGKYAMDFFVFRRGFYGRVPPFAIGRRWFDNWLVWMARKCGADVMDATPSVLAVHQNHDYSHAGGKQSVFSLPSPEVLGNLQAAGGYWHLHGLHEATHRIQPHQITRFWPGTLKLHFYCIRPWRLLWHYFLDLTRPARRALAPSEFMP